MNRQSVRRIAGAMSRLEQAHKRPDEILLVWRKPDGDIRSALADAQFVKGDRVACAEWFGDDPMPKPRWYTNQEMIESSNRAAVSDYIVRSIQRVDQIDRDTAGFAPMPIWPAHRIDELADVDLIHMALGVL